ncbi:zinc finger, C2H2 type [Ancylostoma duodenale]|uniref:Zinc finger, C2H2 type n=1 Tax=Ancylostoma duodenale TaxID=51022 RepID=A0A0C2D2V4_9BILA|nr:zinc finger, C2H2 type [Ancylostoma duodenale]
MAKETALKCLICERTFACKRYLVKHMARVHTKEKEDKKPLECAICGKDFPRLSHLQRHQLIHIKEREWGCPFCERSFVQKPHLVRHIGRCHASEDGADLEDRITANKWRIDDSELLYCGTTFSTRTDLDRHSTNTHRPMKCSHCGEIFDGFAKLKAHEMQQRDQAHVCSCGASFARAAELRTHRDSCRKRGSFLCIACDLIFTQRVQLDRHWNKKHFSNSQCSECGWIATAPLRLSEHALEQHNKKICGYCAVENPEIDHVAAEHWKRLGRSVALRNSGREQLVTTGNKAKAERRVSSSCEEERELSSDDESVAARATCDNLSTASTSSSDSETINTADEKVDCGRQSRDAIPANLPPVQLQSCPPATSTTDTSEECYLNVVVSVPDDVVDEFHFGGRLPPEILRLFPEFIDARKFSVLFAVRYKCVSASSSLTYMLNGCLVRNPVIDCLWGTFLFDMTRLYFC